MRQEAPDKFFGRDCSGFKLLGFAVAKLKRDVAIFQFQQAAIAASNAEDVGARYLSTRVAKDAIFDSPEPTGRQPTTQSFFQVSRGT